MDEAARAHIEENEESSETVEENIERPYKSSFGEIALDENDMTDRWIRYFQGRGRKYMVQYLARSTRYLPMMKNVLRENGLPENLVYLALIESGFSPTAYSHANAAGYWQFIRSTGKRFGLKVDAFTDERCDPVLSTRAAADYLKALYNLFGSWHLAMAAYNVGELRVKRAVAHYSTRDFWKLVKKRRALPAETKQYVPKFIAATLIAKDPKKYGFSDIEYQDPLSYDAVTLKEPISLSKLASNLNVEVDEMRLLNPKFRTDFVPLNKGEETVVRIPVGRVSDALAALSLSVSSQPKVVPAEYIYYRIRRGDNLSTLARRYRTTVSQLRRLNRLSNRTILRVGHRLRVPDHSRGVRYANVEDTATGGASRAVASVERESSAPVFHIVRRGENLSVIAHRYRTTVSTLLRLNGLHSRSILRRGQKLKVREGTIKSASARPAVKKGKRSTIALGQYGKAKRIERDLPRAHRSVAAAATHSKMRRHVVRRGETLYDLSVRYGVSLSELARANNVTVRHHVMAGEKLFIPD
jgi:membrane-bound lytic murein transglycosylase D